MAPLRRPVYLLGALDEKITGAKLPSNGQVLRALLYRIRNQHETVAQACRKVIDETLKFWQRARIPTKLERNCVALLEKLHSRYYSLRKSSQRRSAQQIKAEEDFKGILDDLFDVAPDNVLDLIKNEEDKAFLTNQRKKGRVGCMAGADLVLHNQEKRRQERLAKEEMRIRRYREENKAADKGGGVEQEVDSAEEVPIEDVLPEQPDDDFAGGIVEKQGELKARGYKRKKIDVLTPKLAAALDACCISNPAAVKVVSAVVEALGKDVDDCNVSVSTFQRGRQQFRLDRRDTIMEGFLARLKESPVPLIVHFDGKKIKENHAIQERLPVLVTGVGSEISQLLEIPALESGTGLNMAQAIAGSLASCELSHLVEGACADTTASNTGCNNGACVLLGQLLGTDLLYIACRRHEYEVVLKTVYHAAVGPSSGPEDTLFLRFKEEWPNMDHSKFEIGVSDPEVATALADCSETVMAFLLNKLEEAQPRDNYLEFINLCIIFLGGTPPKGIHFVYPGAVSQARWMAKAIYCLKILMFKKQFSMSKRQEQGIRRVCIFIIKLYAEAWFTTSMAVEAPRRDLQFLKNLVAYQDQDQLVATAATKAFLNHLWYLGDELALMGLFDSAVPFAVKRKMVEAVRCEDTCSEEPCQRPHVKPADAVAWSQKELSDLVSPHSLKLFKRFKIESSFLDVEPELWEEDPQFQKGRSILRTLTVVNDVAERAVALATTYANKLTTDETQRQCAFQVVSDFRKKCPDTKKSTLKKPY